ncbi:Gram-negative bacterial tonB protein [Enhygromyxa salina]|uniref:Gram-negative bacterial tonB protein n=1 Tax=Enhygromyxa salina TaxID=215803 RepID=A0A2S9XE19_9BACT|nr:AgmX/PglI C-terminal domain-containing protein [Enhygromyxa salina]PRP91102.1 Gram-negative bacterial tonB protein [Enhygromyxa salina]
MTTKSRILEHTQTHFFALAGLIGLSLATATTDAAAHPSAAEPQRMGQQAQVDGGLDKATVREIVAARIDDVRECYIAELIEDDTVVGGIVIDFTIVAAGSVHDVTIAESTMPARFDACVAAAVETWQFPSTLSSTEVSYPVVMEPG